jgi:hypothetical protein
VYTKTEESTWIEKEEQTKREAASLKRKRGPEHVDKQAISENLNPTNRTAAVNREMESARATLESERARISELQPASPSLDVESMGQGSQIIVQTPAAPSGTLVDRQKQWMTYIENGVTMSPGKVLEGVKILGETIEEQKEELEEKNSIIAAHIEKNTELELELRALQKDVKAFRQCGNQTREENILLREYVTISRQERGELMKSAETLSNRFDAVRELLGREVPEREKSLFNFEDKEKRSWNALVFPTHVIPTLLNRGMLGLISGISRISILEWFGIYDHS